MIYSLSPGAMSWYSSIIVTYLKSLHQLSSLVIGAATVLVHTIDIAPQLQLHGPFSWMTQRNSSCRCSSASSGTMLSKACSSNDDLSVTIFKLSESPDNVRVYIIVPLLVAIGRTTENLEYILASYETVSTKSLVRACNGYTSRSWYNIVSATRDEIDIDLIKIVDKIIKG